MSDFQQDSYAPEYTTTKVESPAPDSPLALGFRALEDHRQSLESELDQLETRLQASLRPLASVVPMGSPPDEVVPEEPSPHVARVQREARIMEEIALRVRRILERLEV